MKKYNVRLRGKVNSTEDILDLAGTMKPKVKINALKARETMEKDYKRI